jgi:hypothetical protein
MLKRGVIVIVALIKQGAANSPPALAFQSIVTHAMYHTVVQCSCLKPVVPGLQYWTMGIEIHMLALPPCCHLLTCLHSLRH